MRLYLGENVLRPKCVNWDGLRSRVRLWSLRMGRVMSVGLVLSIFEQALLLGSLAVFTAFILWHTTRAPNRQELALRVIALFTGAMVVVGAQASGLSFATFSVNALSNTQSGSAAARIAGAIIPGAVGAWMGWYLTHSMRRDEDIAMRVMGFVGMLAASAFAAIYVVAVDKHGAHLGAAALPNISFVVGVFLYIMLKFQTNPKARRNPGGAQNFRYVWDRVSSGPQRPPAPRVSDLLREANNSLNRTTDVPPASPENPATGTESDS